MRGDKLQLQTQVSVCIFVPQRAPGVHCLCSTRLVVTWELSLLGTLMSIDASLSRVAFWLLWPVPLSKKDSAQDRSAPSTLDLWPKTQFPLDFAITSVLGKHHHHPW